MTGLAVVDGTVPDELIDRRGWAFEKIGPFLRASMVFRYRSKYLEVDNTRLVAALGAGALAGCRAVAEVVALPPAR